MVSDRAHSVKPKPKPKTMQGGIGVHGCNRTNAPCGRAKRGCRVARRVHEPDARAANDATGTAYDTVEEAHAGKK